MVSEPDPMQSAGDIRRAYTFFGRTVVVTSDDRAAIEALDAVYARQRLSMPVPDASADLVVRVVGAAAVPRIEVGGRTIRVPSPDQLVHYAHLVLINAAAALQSDAVVLHSGAVTCGGRAVLLVGHSGRGKTTLTLELVRRGWGFLSDDFAALDARGAVHPLPRRVNLTDESLALLGLRPPEGTVRLATFAGKRKWMIDVEDLFPGSLAEATPVGAVVLLGPTPRSGADAGISGTPCMVPVTWRVQVDHCPADFAGALAALPGVTGVVRADADEAIAFDLATAPGARIVRDLDALCARFDVAVLGARRLAGGEGSDATTRSPWAAHLGSPEVMDVAPAAVVPEVLAHALSLSGARFLGRPGEVEVLRSMGIVRAALSEPVAVARIGPGTLAATADAVEALAARWVDRDTGGSDDHPAGGGDDGRAPGET
jgi:hypothetical protein